MANLSLAIEAQFDRVNWTDITSDVLTVFTPFATCGIKSNQDGDRVPTIGTFTFALNNSITNSGGLSGYYSPGHANCRSGFSVGLPVRVRFTFDGITRTKWAGKIIPGGIVINGSIDEQHYTYITCYDGVYDLANHKLNQLAFTTNKRADEAIALIHANMPAFSLTEDLDAGVYTFTGLFGTLRAYTTALGEISKLVNSERGYYYVTPTRDCDACAVFENRTHRDNIESTTVVPVVSSLCSHILTNDGGYLLNSFVDRVLMNDVENISFSDSQTKFTYANGDNFYNRIVFTVYPQEEFAGTLGSTQSRIALGAGEKKTGYILSYRDPTGGAPRVSLKSETTPASGTDYTMTENRDGTGADLTADLTASYTIGADSAKVDITNGGATDGYVYLQIRGTGIRVYDKIQKITEDTASQEIYGIKELVIDAPYQTDPEFAELFSAVLLALYKEPSSEVISLTHKTSSDSLKQAFLLIGIGNKIPITIERAGVEDNYFIQGVDFNILSNTDFGGALVEFTWHLKPASSDVYSFVHWDTAGNWDDQDHWWFN